MQTVAPIHIRVPRGAEHRGTPGGDAITLPALAIGMARRIISGKVGFSLDNYARQHAVLIRADELLPQEFLGDGDRVPIIKRTREHVPPGHQASLDLLKSMYNVC